MTPSWNIFSQRFQFTPVGLAVTPKARSCFRTVSSPHPNLQWALFTASLRAQQSLSRGENPLDPHPGFDTRRVPPSPYPRSRRGPVPGWTPPGFMEPPNRKWSCHPQQTLRLSFVLHCGGRRHQCNGSCGRCCGCWRRCGSPPGEHTRCRRCCSRPPSASAARDRTARVFFFKFDDLGGSGVGVRPPQGSLAQWAPPPEETGLWEGTQIAKFSSQRSSLQQSWLGHCCSGRCHTTVHTPSTHPMGRQRHWGMGLGMTHKLEVYEKSCSMA